MGRAPWPPPRRVAPKPWLWPHEAARLLLTKKIHRLPVVDASGSLVGVLSRGNLVKAALMIRQQAAAAAAAQ